MKYSGCTFSGLKTVLCTKEITVLGHRCTIKGQLPDESRVAKIVNWGPCKDLMDICAFLGTIGICRLFIKNFSHCTHHIVKLTRKVAPWEFSQDQISAMEDLKQALLSFPTLRPINYASMASVILSVDTSQIAVSFILSQCNLDNPKHQYYVRFSSITLNNREAKSSQPKLELYGLYHALQLLKLYLMGIWNLIIKVDARYIKGMLRNPDISPSASMNRWILAILMFYFTLVHVPGTHHTPDRFSRQKPQPGNKEEPENNLGDCIDNMNSFLHSLNPHLSIHHCITPTPPIAPYVHSDSPTLDNTSSNNQQGNSDLKSYSIIPQSDSAIEADCKLERVQTWLKKLERPEGLSDSEYKTFMQYCTEFVIISKQLWWKNPQGHQKMVVPCNQQLFLITSAHNDIGHHRVYATNALLSEHYWWPDMAKDVKCFI